MPCATSETGQPSTLEPQGFSVGEFLRLADDRLAMLHEDRGFTLGAGDAGAVRHGLTADAITDSVLSVVLPDDSDVGEDHPWEWLAELSRSRGIDVTGDDLRTLPYTVVLTDQVTRWLPGSAGS